MTGLSTWGLSRFTNYWRRRALAAELAHARKVVEKGLQTAGTSPKHKAEVRRSLEELEKIEIDNNMTRVRSLASQERAEPEPTIDNFPA